MPRTKKTDKPLVHEYRAAAIEFHYDEGAIEVDDSAPVSQAEGNPDGGAYVQAWIWIPDEDVTRWKARQAEVKRCETQAQRNRS